MQILGDIYSILVHLSDRVTRRSQLCLRFEINEFQHDLFSVPFSVTDNSKHRYMLDVEVKSGFL